MTQEDKELLLKDLCARLPYGVTIKEQYGDYIQVNLYNAHLEHLIDRISMSLDKVVLRPMSSMTEEEAREYANCGNVIAYSPQKDYLIPNPNSTDWLNSHYFDYRGLIEKGLALEAPEGMYNIKD